MEQQEANALYREKILNFQNAVYNCKELKGLVSNDTQQGNNDYDDRFWTSVYHDVAPDLTLRKDTRLSYGFGGSESSVIFLYDHASKKSLRIKADFDTDKKNTYLNVCRFAQFFEGKNLLAAQFSDRLVLYKINTETLEIEKSIDSTASVDRGSSYFGKPIKTIVFEKNGSNYLASLDRKGDPSLIKFDWETGKMSCDGLPGYMTRFGLLHCLVIKELEDMPIVILGISGKQEVDPDMGYSLFIQNGKKDSGLYNFKNEFFQSWTPDTFVFSEPDKDGYIQIDVSASGILLSKTIVPTNMNMTERKKEEEKVD